MTNRPLHEIAYEIEKDWSLKGKGVYFGAKPYLDAMKSLDDVRGNYGADSAASVVRYFIANANTWRGETARNVKRELNQMVKGIY